MKREAAIAAFLAGAALSIFAAESGPNTDWKAVKQSDGVVIYSRPHGGSNLKEFKAVGEIDATAETVHKVIDAVEGYTRYMPYTAECRVIQRQRASLLTYQRVSPKIVSERDYPLRLRQK